MDWRQQLSVDERNAVIDRIAKFIRSKSPNVAPERVQQLAVQLELNSFKSGTDKKHYLSLISARLAEGIPLFCQILHHLSAVQQRVAAAKPPAAPPMAVPSSALASMAPASVTVQPTATRHMPLPSMPTGTGSGGLLSAQSTSSGSAAMTPASVQSGTTKDPGPALVYFNNQQMVELPNTNRNAEPIRMPILLSMNANERMVLRQRLTKLDPMVRKYYPLVKQVPMETIGTGALTDALNLILRVGRLLQFQMDLSKVDLFYLTTRQLDRIEPQFIAACEQVEALLNQNLAVDPPKPTPSLGIQTAGVTPDPMALVTSMPISPMFKDRQMTASEMKTAERLRSTLRHETTALPLAAQTPEQWMHRLRNVLKPFEPDHVHVSLQEMEEVWLADEDLVFPETLQLPPKPFHQEQSLHSCLDLFELNTGNHVLARYRRKGEPVQVDFVVDNRMQCWSDDARIRYRIVQPAHEHPRHGQVVEEVRQVFKDLRLGEFADSTTAVDFEKTKPLGDVVNVPTLPLDHPHLSIQPASVVDRYAPVFVLKFHLDMKI